MAIKTKDFYVDSNFPALCIQLGFKSMDELLNHWRVLWQYNDPYKNHFNNDDEIFDELLMRCGDTPDNK